MYSIQAPLIMCWWAFCCVPFLQVLYLVDPIDEVAITNLKSYKDKNFIDISKEDLDLG